MNLSIERVDSTADSLECSRFQNKQEEKYGDAA